MEGKKSQQHYRQSIKIKQMYITGEISIVRPEFVIKLSTFGFQLGIVIGNKYRNNLL